MISAASLFKRSVRTFSRIFPRCGMISQAIAFNLFLAFFPTLLLAVSVATSRWGSHTNMLDMITNFTAYLPPGSRQIVSEFMIKAQSASLEIGGYRLGRHTHRRFSSDEADRSGSIHVIYGDEEKPGFLHRPRFADFTVGSPPSRLC